VASGELLPARRRRPVRTPVGETLPRSVRAMSLDVLGEPCAERPLRAAARRVSAAPKRPCTGGAQRRVVARRVRPATHRAHVADRHRAGGWPAPRPGPPADTDLCDRLSHRRGCSRGGGGPASAKQPECSG
jgi:hypothetical protein